MSKIALIQPHFLPYLGYLQIQHAVDEFYYMTEVPLSTPSWQTRNRIRTPLQYDKRLRRESDWTWLTVPIKHGHDRLVWDAKVDYRGKWIASHFHMLGKYYGESKYFNKYMPRIKAIYKQGHKRLAELNIAFLDMLREEFEITTPTLIEREIPYDNTPGGNDAGKTQRLINFCDAVDATLYLEPEGGKDFIIEDMFKEVGIELRFFHFDEEDVYKQLWPGWVSKMSCIDALFCLGPRAKNKVHYIEWYDSEIREDHRSPDVRGGPVG